MIDMVVHRHDLRDTLSRLCSLLVTERKHRAGMNNVKHKKAAAAGASPEIKVPATAEQLSAAANKGKMASEANAEEGNSASGRQPIPMSPVSLPARASRFNTGQSLATSKNRKPARAV